MTLANWDSLGTDTGVAEEFWRFVEARDLRLPYCDACERPYFPPRPRCPRCWAPMSGWRAASGGGTVAAFSIVRYAIQRGPWAERLPYVVALVDLDGVRVLSNVVGCEPEAVTTGMAVTLDYTELDDRVLYVFRPA